MPRPRKPLALHLSQGTYRKDRHGAWGNPQPVPPPRLRCQFCGQLDDDDFFAASKDERHWICGRCVAGAVLLFEKNGFRVVADDVLVGYGWTPPSDQGGDQ